MNCKMLQVAQNDTKYRVVNRKNFRVCFFTMQYKLKKSDAVYTKNKLYSLKSAINFIAENKKMLTNPSFLETKTDLKIKFWFFNQFCQKT